ncbi:MAG: T9SS type A sorting domain-containing protein, partial [Bacteroidota bacterium]
TGYATVQSISYDLGVGANPVTAPGDVLATFEADLSGAGGSAGIVVASGFLNAANNNDGVPFGLVLFLPDNIGQGLLLPLVTNIDDLIVSNESLNVFPNPALDRTQISFDLVSTADVAFRLYDLNGRVVWESDVTKTAGAHQMELDLTSIAGGNYTLVMMYENRVSYQRLQIAK